jgi:phage terminase small subunit
MATKPKKVNVSINPETMDALTRVREKLGSDLGFTPSYSQVIQHLIKNEQIHPQVEMFNNQGEINEHE